MPFIRGRYHINPIAGEALENAREAEAALLGLEHEARNHSQDEGEDFPSRLQSGNAGSDSRGPIHHIEIERAQLTPPHSGHAESGFVARIHRHEVNQTTSPFVGVAQGQLRRKTMHPGSPRSETHVFSRHQDLVDFLSKELDKDCSGQ